jgi:hypothetical protein
MYYWTITKDHIDTDSEGTSSHSLRIRYTLGLGPPMVPPVLGINPAHFSLYDDDGECYYEGMLYGDYTGFEPLDNFGTPNAGCTKVKLAGEWL